MPAMPDLVGLSQLSNDVYQENREGSPTYVEVADSFVSNGDSGFQAITYYRSSTNTLVITYAGTDIFGGGDIDDDWDLALGRTPEQASEAVNYATQ